MIVELLGFGLAVIGIYTVCHCIHQKLAFWLKPHCCSNEEKRPPASTDPSQSFTLELIRTVLEHQAQREDQSRRELAFLMSQLASTVPPSERNFITFYEQDKTAKSVCNDVREPNVNTGRIGWAIRQLLPWRKH